MDCEAQAEDTEAAQSVSDALDALSDATGVDGFSYRGEFFKFWEMFPPVAADGTLLENNFVAGQETQGAAAVAAAGAPAESAESSEQAVGATASQSADAQSPAQAVQSVPVWRAVVGVLALIALVF